MISKKNKKGFTLMEMLIVVAIIAILIAILIPTFSAQLEKSREATDAANIRAAYAEVQVAYLNGDTKDYSKTYTLQQKQDEWQNETLGKNLAKLVGEDGTYDDTNLTAEGECTISVDEDGAVSIVFGAASDEDTETP